MRLCVACRSPLEGAGWRCADCGWTAPEEAGIPILSGYAPEGEGFSKAYFQDLALLEAGHFWFRSRNRLIGWAYRKFARAQGSFLELGCGTGFVLNALAGLAPATRFTGTEYHVEGLPFARERVPGAAFLQLDARRMPYEAEFDGIGLFDVLEHILEDDQVLAAVSLACKPGARIFITVPQHPWLWSVVDEKACHVRRYTRADLLERLNKAGLRPLLATSFVTLLLPLVILSRRRRNLAREAFDPFAEFNLAPWKNRVLEGILSLERLLIRAGIHWPAGSSLLVVAEKP